MHSYHHVVAFQYRFLFRMSQVFGHDLFDWLNMLGCFMTFIRIISYIQGHFICCLYMSYSASHLRLHVRHFMYVIMPCLHVKYIHIISYAFQCLICYIIYHFMHQAMLGHCFTHVTLLSLVCHTSFACNYSSCIINCIQRSLRTFSCMCIHYGMTSPLLMCLASLALYIQHVYLLSCILLCFLDQNMHFMFSFIL